MKLFIFYGFLFFARFDSLGYASQNSSAGEGNHEMLTRDTAKVVVTLHGVIRSTILRRRERIS